MKFSEKMILMVILKVTKNQDFNFSLDNTVLEKPQGLGPRPPSLLRDNACAKMVRHILKILQ